MKGLGRPSALKKAEMGVNLASSLSFTAVPAVRSVYRSL